MSVQRILDDVLRRQKVTTMDDMGDPVVTWRKADIAIVTVAGLYLPPGEIDVLPAAGGVMIKPVDPLEGQEVFVPFDRIDHVRVTWHDA